MIIKRDTYLSQLISGMGNRMIKVVTGIRRCGKSFLLFELFHNYLIESGVSPNHIIEIALDDRRFANLRNPDNIIEYIDSRITDNGQYYILLDEVQLLDEFVDVLNSLLHIKNADVYVTGSNSKFLSSDVATEFRGRGFNIHIFPLSFAEYLSAVSLNKYDAWRDFYLYGSLPQILAIEGDRAKQQFLAELAQTVFLADVAERNKIKNRDELSELFSVLASSIGAPVNPTKLSNTFRSVKKVAISSRTIAKYLQYLCNAYLIEKSIRYNIKGKKYISTLAKYYFTDIGLRNAILGFRQVEETHLMENAIYNELRIRGYSIDVGCVEIRQQLPDGSTRRSLLEVDFVANRGYSRLYIQSALHILDEAKMQQESASLRRIDDSFQKVIIVKDDIAPYQNNDGFLIVGLFDFLLKPALISGN